MLASAGETNKTEKDEGKGRTFQNVIESHLHMLTCRSWYSLPVSYIEREVDILFQSSWYSLPARVKCALFTVEGRRYRHKHTVQTDYYNSLLSIAGSHCPFVSDGTAHWLTDSYHMWDAFAVPNNHSAIWRKSFTLYCASERVYYR